jgi:hypothetical protein
MLEEIG